MAEGREGPPPAWMDGAGAVTKKDEKETQQGAFIRKGFTGTVMLTDWMTALHNGNSYVALSGVVSVLSAEELLGFDVNDRDSRWAAVIEGPTQRYVIPGCKVRGVVSHPGDTEIQSQNCLEVP